MNEESKKIILRYGELVLKGKNRMDFIYKLKSNMETYDLKPEVFFDHMFLDYSDKNVQIIKNIFGLSSYSIIHLVQPNLENLKKDILSYINKNYFDQKISFKIKTTRKNKNFDLNSDQINREIAKIILENTSLYVDIHKFDILIEIKIDEKEFYFFTKRYKLLGGLPIGISGKSLHLISGGFDSPVAAYLMMKRGIELEFINFITPPHTDDLTVKKTKDILQYLTKYQPHIKLHLVKYTNLMNYINLVSKQAYKITLMRRSFYRIASKIASSINALCLSNGENIGQVASQTLESIFAISKSSLFPIIRPLATYDKIEIINIAKEIQTYDISVINSNEACELFAPKAPITKPNLHTLEILENELNDLSKYENECIDNEIIVLNFYFKDN